MPPTTSMSAKFRIPLFFAFIIAGLAGNYFKYPIFHNIDFLFGSIFAMLALQFFGLSRGIMAAAAIAAYTYILWNHPYAIIIMTAEVAVVGFLMGRRKIGMVLADTVFWLFIGIPLVYFFYHSIMHTQFNSTMLFMGKQAVNGILNALIARLLFAIYIFRSRTLQIHASELLSLLLLFFVVMPTFIILAISSRDDLSDLDKSMRENLVHDSRRITQNLKEQLDGNGALAALVEMQTLLQQEQLRHFMDINRSNVTMQFTLLDKNRNIIASSYSDQIPALPSVRKNGTLTLPENGVSLWTPVLSSKTPIAERWKKALYICESGIGNVADWKLILEQPLSPHLEILYARYSLRLFLLFVMILISQALAELLSRSFARRIGQFAEITHDLPRKISSNQEIEWFKISIVEANFVADNFKEAVNTIQKQIIQLQLANQIQEQRVAERTNELQKSRDEWIKTFNSITDMVFILDTQCRIVHANRAASEILGILPDEIVGQHCHQVIHGLDIELDCCPHKLLMADGEMHEADIFEPRLNKHFHVSVTPLLEGGVLIGSVHIARDITLRKQSEILKNEAFDRLNKIAGRVPGVVYQYRLRPDGTSCFPFASEAIREIYGVSPNEVKEDATIVFTTIVPEDFDGVVASIQRSARDLTLWHHEYRVKLAGGKVRWLLGNALPELEADGSILWHGFISDITARKLIDATLQSSEEKLSTMVSNISDVIGIIGVDGVIKYKSPNIGKYFGWQPEDLIGTDGWSTVHPDDLERIQKELGGLLENDNSVKIVEYGYKCKDGSYKPISLTATNLVNNPTICGVLLNYHDITEQKKAKERLIENEERFRNMFTNHSAIMLLIEPKSGNIIDANMAAEQFYGYPRTKLLTMNINDINQLSPEQIRSERLLALERNSNYFIFPHKIATGEIRTIEVHSTPITVSGTKILFSIVHDITERKQAEYSLKENRERLAHIIDGTKAGTWEWNVQTGETLFNVQWAGIIGYTLEEISPVSIETWMKFAHPDDLKESGELLERHFRGELEYYECESRMKHKSGHWVWVLDRGKVCSWADDGRPLWMFGTHIEITKRKLAEEALIESEERFRSMANATPALIWISGTDKLCYWFNQVWLDFTGRSMEQEAGNGWAEGVHPDDLDRCIETYVTAFDSRQPFTMEYRLRAVDGTYRWLIDNGVPTYADKTFTGYIGSCMNITGQKQIEEKLLQAKELAESAVLAKSRFLSIVAHEFYTPLHLLSISTDILEQYKGHLSAEEQVEQLEQIQNASHQLTSLIDSVSAYNRREGLVIVPALLNISQICAKISDEINKVWGKEHNSHAVISSDCGMGLFDEVLFRRLLENLITNAYRFTPAGGSVSLSVNRVGDRLLIEVADTGIGIPEEDQKRIFEAFYRSSNVDARRGLGLGLSVVNDSLLALNGSISLKSKIGVGTTFNVELPIVCNSESLELLP